MMKYLVNPTVWWKHKRAAREEGFQKSENYVVEITADEGIDIIDLRKKYAITFGSFLLFRKNFVEKTFDFHREIENSKQQQFAGFMYR